MNNRSIVYMTGAVLVCVALLLGFNMFSLLHEKDAVETYLKYNDVRGVDVIHNQKAYTLNFQQQKHLIALLNQAKKTNEKPSSSKEGVDFEKVTIYLFKGPNVELIPIALDHKHLIYSVPKWNPNGSFEDTTGELITLISQTYN